MGSQCITYAQRRTCAPLSIALLILLSFLHATKSSAQSTTSSTSALAVPLILPSAIVFDATGNLYLADASGNVIREVDTLGHIVTIAGNGTQGFFGDNGPATAAGLDSPEGLALDTSGDLYIADTHNHRVRRLSLATGMITTVGGTGTAGYSGDGASATAAQLDQPTALALDAGNNLYFADTGNHRIRRVDATTGIITTVAGNGIQGYSGDNGPAANAAIDSPTGVAVAANSLYLADTHNQRIRRLDLMTGMITTIAGSGSLGCSGDTALANSAALALPHGLTVDPSGNIYIADAGNHRIRRIDAVTGVISTVAGNGTQTFSGDNGPAISASLDTPRAVTLSASNLVTLADTGNQRIRQLDAAPAPATEIHTIAGLGVTVPGALTLNAPSVIAYGTGQVLAVLSTSSPATGNVAFLDAGNAFSTLGAEPLVANTASFATDTLPAGTYNVTATYAGDQTHLSAESSAIAFRIAPQPLSVSVASIDLNYGQSIPSLTGNLIGVLPQDAGNVSVSFSTAAFTLSPAGTYPITASLGGSAAGNYVVAAIPATITIYPASTSTSISNLVATATAGSALTLITQVGSSAAAAPIGTITLLDGATPIATVALSATGIATFSNVSLSAGVHSLTALYSGSTNFSSSSSAPQQITITAGSSVAQPTASGDFTLAATGASTQTILSGTSANFTFAIQPQGSISSPVTLGATGLPNLATASFNPSTIPPGATANNFVLTIATPETVASTHVPSPMWALCFLPIVGLGLRRCRRTLPAKLLGIALFSMVLFAANGCGDRVNTASAAAVAGSQSYTITVTGTATTSAGTLLQHSTKVTLILQPAS
jgi:sugar lactone lactonase YvrE